MSIFSGKILKGLLYEPVYIDIGFVKSITGGDEIFVGNISCTDPINKRPLNDVEDSDDNPSDPSDQPNKKART